MWRVLPNSLLEPLGKRDSETGAADLICQSTDWIADRDASLAVEQAAVNGTKRIGDVLITSGVSGGLFLSILATIDPGDEAILETLQITVRNKSRGWRLASSGFGPRDVRPTLR